MMVDSGHHTLSARLRRCTLTVFAGLITRALRRLPVWLLGRALEDFGLATEINMDDVVVIAR